MTFRACAFAAALLLVFGSGLPVPATATVPLAHPSPSEVNHAAPALPTPNATFTVGTLRVQRYGRRGHALVLIPGLEGGPWVWQTVIRRFRHNHVIYAVTLAGFDGVPPPKDHHDLLEQADASLLRLIRTRHINKPVLVGHSLGGTLSIDFAERHSGLIAGVIAVDGLPVFPGMQSLSSAQRSAGAAKIASAVKDASPQRYQAQILDFMLREGTLSPRKAKRAARLSGLSNQGAVAVYLKDDMSSDFRPRLRNIHVPLLEISPYYAPDFSSPPMQFSEAQKAALYKHLLAGAPDARVVSISPSRHFVMLDQPRKLNDVIASFLRYLP